MRLTKNFRKSEFNCKCGCEMPIEVLENVKIVANQLQEVRDYFKKSIKVTSGYRCRRHNMIVGGVRDSRHLIGASDIQIKDIEPSEVFIGMYKLMQESRIAKGGLAQYNTFTHYDNRGYFATW